MKYFIFIFLILLSGCKTNAAREFDSKIELKKIADNKYEECRNRMRKLPEVIYVRENLIPDNDKSEKTYELLSKKEKISEIEKRYLFVLIGEKNECFKNYATNISRFDFRLATFLLDTNSESNNLFYKLLNDEITISEFTTTRLQRQGKFEKDYNSLMMNIVNEYQRMHESEIARIQNTAQEGFREGFNREMERQRAIEIQNSQNNKTYNTQCYSSGNYTNCTTR